MNLIQVLATFLAGVCFGMIYFGHLRWTVNYMQSTRHPAMVYGVSVLFRMSLAFLVVYYALHAGIILLLIGLGGFIAARLALVTRSVFVPVNSRRPEGGL